MQSAIQAGGRGLPAGLSLARLRDRDRAGRSTVRLAVGDSAPERETPAHGFDENGRHRGGGARIEIQIQIVNPLFSKNGSSTGGFDMPTQFDISCLTQNVQSGAGRAGGTAPLSAASTDRTESGDRPDFSVDQVLAWADAFFGAHGGVARLGVRTNRTGAGRDVVHGGRGAGDGAPRLRQRPIAARLP